MHGTSCNSRQDFSLAQQLLIAVQVPWKLWITSHVTDMRGKQESNDISKTLRKWQNTQFKHSRWQQAPCLLSLFFCSIQPRKLFKNLDTHMDTTCEPLLIYCFFSTSAIKCRLLAILEEIFICSAHFASYIEL